MKSYPATDHALDGNLALFKQLVDTMPVASMFTNRAGTILHCNGELAALLGYESVEAMIGLHLGVFVPSSIREKHGSLVESFFDFPTKRLMGQGKSLQARRQDGTHIPIEIGLNPLKTDDESLVLATVVDLSARLQASFMFEQSLKSSPLGILLVDKAGYIRFCNEPALEAFGYSESELKGQPIDYLLPERYQDKHHEYRSLYFSDPKIRMMGQGRDLTALHKNGDEFPVEIGLSPLNDEKYSVLVTVTDITLRKKMETELKESNKNLEEFTYIASHDLRSPIRGIADLLEWIKEDINTGNREGVDRNIARMELRIGKVGSLIDSLLAYARAGKKFSDLENVNIEELIDRVIDFLEPPDKFKFSKHLSIKHVLASATPLEIVFRNLISNAIKHHDKENGEIEISATSKGNMVRFSISDNGPGIPEASIDRIFSLFQTASLTRRDDDKGSGIGLSVSRRIVETHGGEVSVENNNGATFHVDWPRYIRRDVHEWQT